MAIGAPSYVGNTTIRRDTKIPLVTETLSTRHMFTPPFNTYMSPKLSYETDFTKHAARQTTYEKTSHRHSDGKRSTEILEQLPRTWPITFNLQNCTVYLYIIKFPCY